VLDELAANVVIGDRLGLYRALAAAGPSTPDELAAQTGAAARFVAEWLAGQAADGYVTYEPASDRYRLSPEQAFALANPDSPAFLPGAFRAAKRGLMVVSRHQTSEGTIAYLRCGCGSLQVWLTTAGQPVRRLTRTIRGPQQPPGCRPSR
jgi:hypothetical protein